jgi:hypothetical protein
VDASWEDEDEPDAAVDEDVEPTFEPDVPLVAEVNREAGESSDRRRRLGVLGAGAALVAGIVLRRRRRRR